MEKSRLFFRSIDVKMNPTRPRVVLDGSGNITFERDFDATNVGSDWTSIGVSLPQNDVRELCQWFLDEGLL